jgi:poly(3-hydroxybutyrate) depolymerase
MEPLTHFDELADKEGFLVVYPQGLDNRWADARDGATPTNNDDVGFVRALLDDLKRRIAYDPTRVYATGVSIGGFFVARLGCEAADRIAAIGVVAATIPPEAPLQAGPGVSVSRCMVQTNVRSGGWGHDQRHALVLAPHARGHRWTDARRSPRPTTRYRHRWKRACAEIYPGCAETGVVFYIIEAATHSQAGRATPRGCHTAKHTQHRRDRCPLDLLPTHTLQVAA